MSDLMPWAITFAGGVLVGVIAGAWGLLGLGSYLMRKAEEAERKWER